MLRPRPSPVYLEDSSTARRAGNAISSRWASLLVFAVALLFSSPSLFMGLHADDWFQIRPRSCGQLLATFSGDWNIGARGVGGFYRPLTRLSFAADQMLHRSSAAGCHATNALMFAIIAVALLFICRRLCREPGLTCALAVLALLIFNPLKNEALFWVSGRTDLLATLFVTAAVATGLASLARNSLLLSIASIALLLAGLLSKEVAIAGTVILPAAALLLSPIPRCQSRAANVLLFAPPIAGAMYFAARWKFLGGLAGYAITEPITVTAIGENMARIFSALCFPWQVYLSDRFIPWLAIPGALMCVVPLMFFRLPRAPLFSLIACIASAAPMATLVVSPLDGMRVLMLPLVFFASFLMAMWNAPEFPNFVKTTFKGIAFLFFITLLPMNVQDVTRLIRARGPNDTAIAEAVSIVNALEPGSIVIIPEGPHTHSRRVLDPGAALLMAVESKWLAQDGNTSANIASSDPPRAAISLSGQGGERMIAPNLQPWMAEATILVFAADLRILPIQVDRTKLDILTVNENPIELPGTEGEFQLLHATEEVVSSSGGDPSFARLTLKGNQQPAAPLIVPMNGKLIAWQATGAGSDTPTTSTLCSSSSALSSSFLLHSVKVASYRFIISPKEARSVP